MRYTCGNTFPKCMITLETKLAGKFRKLEWQSQLRQMRKEVPLHPVRVSRFEKGTSLSHSSNLSDTTSKRRTDSFTLRSQYADATKIFEFYAKSEKQETQNNNKITILSCGLILSGQ